MEGVESALLAVVQCPGFAAIQQCAEHAGLVLVVSMELSHTLVARRAIAVDALPILVFELGVQREVAGDGRAKVDKIIHHFQCVVADGEA